MANPLKKKLAVAVAGQVGIAEAALSHLHGVLRLLAKDHRRCMRLLDFILESNDAQEREAQWREFRQELLAHEYAEIEAVFSRVKPDEPLRALLAQHTEDAVRNETLISELDALPLGSDEWLATLRLLQQAVTNHIYEEENELFPMLEQALGKEGVSSAEPRFAASKRKATEHLANVNSVPAPPLQNRPISGLPLHDLQNSQNSGVLQNDRQNPRAR